MKASRLIALVAGAMALAPSVSLSQPAPAAPGAAPAAPARPTPPPVQSVPLGYIELSDDARYELMGSYANIDFRDIGRPYEGAAVAIAEAQQTGRFMNIDFSIEKFAGETVEEMVAQIDVWIAANTHFVVVDLPADILVQLAEAVAGRPVSLFNVSAQEDALRAENCRANVFHTMPSFAMYEDALAQYLSTKNWRDVLVLQGPLPADRLIAEAFQRSSRKFGLRVSELVPFVITNDPRYRDQTNVALLTAGKRFDVVFVADAGRELARFVPYQTTQPNLVVGSSGLTPLNWHWTWESDAAAQLQHRYEELAMPRQMNDVSFAAWSAVRAITTASIRTRSGEFAPIQAYLTDPENDFDSVKGNPQSFRPWDNQMRTPILLATANAVIARAPFDEFLHEFNVLDTLGVDEAETACRMRR
jgi:ABC transporter substrate binding protein (PQQ-dependent alcohol dehydrogenase system)